MAEILVNPRVAPLDTTLDIVVVGLPPDEKATVRLNTGDRSSRAVFLADERGVVDLSRHAPIAGSYHGVDPMGLFWSLEHTGGQPGPTVLSVDDVGEVDLVRQHVPDGVRRTEVREGGLVGTLFAPENDGGELPGVILLDGLKGGLPELDAAQLARHGFVVFALAYFGAPGLPDFLADVPLEYFGTAIDFLSERAGEIAVVGVSRGGEAALLIGATFPQIRAVVSVVGGGVLTAGIGPGRTMVQMFEHEVASWTWHGEPLPYLPFTISDELRMLIVNSRPVPSRLLWDTSDGIGEELEIPVERIVGGVLLISSAHDDAWPSTELSEVAMRRLKDHDHPFPYEHVVYSQAGHDIVGPPHQPTTDLVLPGPGVSLCWGGTPEANAAARADAWKRTVEFLSDQLGT